MRGDWDNSKSSKSNGQALTRIMQILPGVLAYDEVDFKKRLLHTGLNKVADIFHVDVLDGSLFNATCWAEASVVGTWKSVPEIELHCMVQDPLPVIKSWYKYVPSLKRVIVHKEIGAPLQHVIDEVKLRQLEIIVAVNPDTPVDEVKHLEIDGLLVMGVAPGASGQPFLGEPILSKLRRARVLFPNLLLAIDGGVNTRNLHQIQTAGASRCVASSALWKSANPEEEYENLLSKLS